MSDISIQFHALPEELLPLVEQSVREHRLHVVKMRFFPFEAVEVSPEQLSSVFADSAVGRIALTVTPPDLPANNEMRFLDQNVGALVLDVGRQEKKGLGESWLAARTDDEELLSIWRSIAKRLKAMTKAGAVAVNPATGAEAPVRNHRYTEGAKALETKGVPILPVGGKNRLRLGSPSKK